MKKTYLFILLSFISIMVYGQAAKVILYGAPTAKQKKLYQLEKQSLEIQSRISSIENKISWYETTSYQWYSDYKDKAKLQQIITNYKAKLSRLQSSVLQGLYEKYIEVNREMGVSKDELPDNRVKAIENILRKNISRAKTRINELEGIKAKKDEHNQEMAKLDNQLKSINNDVANQDNQLKQYNNKSESLNDFLASVSNNTKKTNGDFLDKSGSKGSSDFLASSTNSNDPLSSSNNKKNWKISYRTGGLQGVTDNEGNDLIPFKKWRILEYKDGIAKVKILLDSYSCGDDCIGYYTAQIYKEGFVDKSGSFLDGDKVSYNIDWKSMGCLRLVSSNESYDQIQRDKEYDRHMDRIKKSKWERETKAWVLNNINQYK